MSARQDLVSTGKHAETGIGSRSIAIDVVRVVGVIAIVAGHTWAEGHFTKVGLYTWHVPVFFVITGYLWKSGRTTWDETRKRARTLLVPYLSWLIVVSLIWFGFRAARGESFDTHLLRNLPLGGHAIGRPYTAFWFVTCLFFAAVLMRWLDGISGFLPWYAAGVGIAWCIGRRADLADIPEAAGLALPAIAFMLVGRVLQTYRSTIVNPLLFGLLLAVPAWWLGWSGAITSLNMKGGNLGTPGLGVLMAAAISCGLILAAEGVERFIPGWAHRAIFAVNACAIPVILTHTLSLAVTQRLGYPASTRTFLIAYFAPLSVALLIRATPARKLLS